jgi:hypothetical protein
MKPSVILICASIILSACEADKFGFNAPVPIKGKKLQSFDKELIGSYYLADKSKILIKENLTTDQDTSYKPSGLVNIISITKDSLNNSIHGMMAFFKDSLSAKDRSDLLLNHAFDSAIIENFRNPVYSYEIDSSTNRYIIKVSLKSNLFAINDSGILIRYKGFYYLNSFHKNNRQWFCFQLAPAKSKKELSINTISNDNITILKELIRSECKVVDTVYVPSMKVFKQFLKQGGFGNKINLIKYK